MSEITRFNQDVLGNIKMMEELKAIGNDIDKVIAFANSKGYEFTMNDLVNCNSQSGELSEEELGNVAGGIVCVTDIGYDFDRVFGGVAQVIVVM